MGWNGGLIFGMMYWLVPKIFRTPLFSKKMANTHFWLATLGIILFAIPLYWAAITQWLMLREYSANGMLAHPIFMETQAQIHPMYMFRIVGGFLYLVGLLLFVYNIVKTMGIGKLDANEVAEGSPRIKELDKQAEGEPYHRYLERTSVRFAIFVFLALIVGGAVEIIPMLKVESNIPKISTVTPYSPLELAGRDIYISNGCYNCHSQQIRPLRWETDRYGEYSKIGESVYDHPFQWGSRRTGPDLARAGYVGSSTYKSDSWHFAHFMNPRDMYPQSIMPKYPWFAVNQVDLKDVKRSIEGMITLGVPYPKGYADIAAADYMKQATQIVTELKQSGTDIKPTSEMVAIIAYLHKLGRDISPESIEKLTKTKE
jgi:cytochrome c oxidase cbb3-type subunit I/II